jgi:hypothetical protein
MALTIVVSALMLTLTVMLKLKLKELTVVAAVY